MRRVTRIAFVAGGTLAVVGAGTFARRRLQELPTPVGGVFSNGMAYARLGTGPKSLLFIRSGPGNVVPTGLPMALMGALWIRPFLEDGYTTWVATRKRDMPKGYTVPEMAEDYAGLIEDEFGGKVDLVVGEDSYGGMIGFCLAARHPDRLDHLAISLSGYRLNDEGKAVQLDFARLMSEGRRGEAGALMIGHVAPGLTRPGLDRMIGAALVRFMFPVTHPYFAKDVVTEAEAVAAFDARVVLPEIAVPVLLFGCDQDVEFPREVYEETARLIPDCTLKLFEGKNPFQAGSDKRIPLDVLDFVRDHPPVRQERRSRKGRIADQQVVPDESLVAPGEPPLRGEEPAGPEPSLAGTGVG
jgi:pimeloyl-ACP methyl ester carboxylesterase